MTKTWSRIYKEILNHIDFAGHFIDVCLKIMPESQKTDVVLSTDCTLYAEGSLTCNQHINVHGFFVILRLASMRYVACNILEQIIYNWHGLLAENDLAIVRFSQSVAQMKKIANRPITKADNDCWFFSICVNCILFVHLYTSIKSLNHFFLTKPCENLIQSRRGRRLIH